MAPSAHPASPTVALITPGHLASTPRLVKEADALAAVGYTVHVITGHYFPPAEPLDAAILATAKWTHTPVDLRDAGAPARKFLRHLARRLITRSAFASVGLAARAHHADALRLARAAARIPAQFYLGHCLAGLPAAAFAAKARGVPYGFDAEDYHDAETDDASADRAEAIARRILQRGLLPGCAHFTASSPLIGARYATTYGVPVPRTVMNVFPRTHAPQGPIDPGPITAQRPARVYWFSQTVGSRRGLEAVIAILGAIRTPVELHLRGFPSSGYAAQLTALATRAGLARPIQFLAPGPPTEMARLAATADLGLSVEESQPLNHDLCLANKIFVYLLAGIPQLLSHTSAHAALAPELKEAAILGRLERVDETAAALDSFFSDPARVSAARRRAWELAQTRFCWDLAQENFLASVRAAVAGSSRTAQPPRASA
jgi:hypothetical protein